VALRDFLVKELEVAKKLKEIQEERKSEAHALELAIAGVKQ
jgi:hypothetical protein